jgi:hypothetical protein
LSRLDRDYLVAALNCFGLYFLLRTGFQGPFTFRLGPHPLDRIHDVRLLREERVSQIGRPLDVSGHSLDHVWSRGQSLDAWIPRLLGHSVCQCFVFQIFVPIHPLLKLNDLQWVRGSGQDLGEERIGIKRDRRNQGIQLIRRELRNLFGV